MLTNEQKDQLLLSSKEVFFEAGHYLFHQGDVANHTYLVKKGRISLFRLMPNGDEKLFKVFLADDVIAEMAMFMTPRQYPMSAKIEQDSILLEFGYQALITLVSESPTLSIKVMHYMSNKIAGLMNRVDILTQVKANQRLVMRLAELYRTQIKKEGKVVLPVTKKLLATQLGMTPETLSRMIKKFKDDGYIVEHGHYITIINIVALCDSVDLTPDIFETSLC